MSLFSTMCIVQGPRCPQCTQYDNTLIIYKGDASCIADHIANAYVISDVKIYKRPWTGFARPLQLCLSTHNSHVHILWYCVVCLLDVAYMYAFGEFGPFNVGPLLSLEYRKISCQLCVRVNNLVSRTAANSSRVNSPTNRLAIKPMVTRVEFPLQRLLPQTFPYVMYILNIVYKLALLSVWLICSRIHALYWDWDTIPWAAGGELNLYMYWWANVWYIK